MDEKIDIKWQPEEQLSYPLDEQQIAHDTKIFFKRLIEVTKTHREEN